MGPVLTMEEARGGLRSTIEFSSRPGSGDLDNWNFSGELDAALQE